MQRVIREKFSDHTIIAVAHKLDTILDFDKVAMLDGGQLIEFDDPYTLLNQDSAFGKLYNNTMTDQNIEEVVLKDNVVNPRDSISSSRTLRSSSSDHGRLQDRESGK